MQYVKAGLDLDGGRLGVLQGHELLAHGHLHARHQALPLLDGLGHPLGLVVI